MRNLALKKLIAMLGVTALIATSVQPALYVSAADETAQNEVTQTEVTADVTNGTDNSGAGQEDPAAAVTAEPAAPAGGDENKETEKTGSEETGENAEVSEDTDAAEAAEETAGEGATEWSADGSTLDTEVATVNEPLSATPVETVTEMLEAIDSLSQMQTKRRSYNNAADYETYLTEMNQKREEAQAAYDALTDEEKAQINADLVKKLTDTLDTVYNLNKSYTLVPRDDEYNYQAITASTSKWVAYELSNNMNVTKDFAVICPVVDVSGSATSWKPDGAYSYGSNNYELCYCCDLRQPVKHQEHYKRVNLESSDYYSKDAASHIRAIVQSAYPYVSLDTMKANLKSAGFSQADDLTRSDIIAAVQFAIWRYSNEWTNAEEITERTTYGGTFNAGRLGYFDQIHDYFNELWNWWPNSGSYNDAEVKERVNALTDYLAGLPGVEPDDNQIIISDVKISRTDLVPGENNTYSLGLNIFLNHGTGSGDDVKITVTTTDSNGNVTDTKTISMGSATKYDTTVKAKDGDTVKVTVEGTQNLAKGVYFYDPVDGIDESQALVSVAQGETKVKAEKSFTFEREIDAGIRIFKTNADTDEPMEGIVFKIYKVSAEKTAEDVPTEEEIAKYAVDANLAGTVTTDATGYAHIKLSKGVYLLVEEPNDKIKAPVKPMYVQLPVPKESVNEEGDIEVTYEDVATLKIKNIPYEKGKVSVILEATKDFNDWGKAQSFTFKLEAVTDGAPMPSGTTAEATLENKTAEFGLIKFTKTGTYEYTITEIDDGVENVTYDTTPHKVVVNITKNEDGDLVDEVTYDGAESLTITNTYKEEKPSKTSVVFGGHKTIEGIDKTDLVFHFVLVSTLDGSDYRDEATVTGSGDFAFDKITYDEEGIYLYEITETRGSEKNWKYDSKTYEVTVKVEKNDDNELVATVSGLDDGKANFTNRYVPPYIPKVGDDANYVLWGALAAAAAGGIGVVLYRRKKKEEE